MSEDELSYSNLSETGLLEEQSCEMEMVLVNVVTVKVVKNMMN